MGYWPSVRSRWPDIGQVLFWRVHRPSWKTCKKRMRPISSNLNRTIMVTFVVGCSEQHWAVHVANNSSTSFGLSLPIHEARHILKAVYGQCFLNYHKLKQSLLLTLYILINFQEASSILETIYSDYANSAQKAFLIQEFYGADFAFFKVTN